MAATIPPPDSTQAPDVPATYGGTLRVAGEAEAGSPWTPAAVQCDSFCHMRIRTVIEPLVTFDDNLQLQPFLAESITPERRLHRVGRHGAQGITFSDGTPADADAVIYNLQATGTGLLVSSAVQDIARVNGDPNGPLMIDKTGDMSLRITLGADGDPEPAGELATVRQLPARAVRLDRLPRPGSRRSRPARPRIGDGRHRTVRAPGLLARPVDDRGPQPGLLADRPTSGDQLPYLDQIEFLVISDAKKMSDALRTGTVDLIATSDGSNINSFDGDDDYPTELQYQYGETSYILFHLTQPGLDDRRVRCTLNQAVDKQALIDTVYGGNLDVANGPFSPGQEGFLADNGSLALRPGRGPRPDRRRTSPRPARPRRSSTARPSTATTCCVPSSCRAPGRTIGVKVEVQQTEQSVFITNALFGTPDFGAFGWRQHAGIYVDTQNYWWNGAGAAPDGESSLNFARLNDPGDQRPPRSGPFGDRPRRPPGDGRGQINQQFAKECWILPLWFTKWGIIHTPKVQGIGTTPQPSGDGTLRDGPGFPGHIWFQGVFLAS